MSKFHLQDIFIMQIIMNISLANLSKNIIEKISNIFLFIHLNEKLSLLILLLLILFIN